MFFVAKIGCCLVWPKRFGFCFPTQGFSLICPGFLCVQIWGLSTHVITIRYVALFWALPTPQIIEVTTSDQEFSHLVTNWGLLLQVSELEFNEMQKLYEVKVMTLFLFELLYKPSQFCYLLNLDWCLHFAHISCLIITCVFCCSFLTRSLGNIPLKCRSDILQKKWPHILQHFPWVFLLPLEIGSGSSRQWFTVRSWWWNQWDCMSWTLASSFHLDWLLMDGPLVKWLATKIWLLPYVWFVHFILFYFSDCILLIASYIQCAWNNS